ncbi:helix-turn-helix domain-containing protein [Roseomonas sp. BN140053]|uniref:helix-turn-helix domain-containing protein n=1 Tax=Roseomonas sp. BN140053 TaxID=3391898 RepID=UPI0039E837D4
MTDTTDDTDFGRELIASLEQAAAIVRGEAEPARVHLAADVPDVRAIRAGTGLSREAFADRFGLKLAAVRDWEQGLRKPDPAARTLLRVIAREPEAVVRALAPA